MEESLRGTPKVTKKRPTGRPPIGGYGTQAERLDTTIRLPRKIKKYVEKKSPVAKFVRELIIDRYQKDCAHVDE